MTTAPVARRDGAGIAPVVRAAAAGDDAAWSVLVKRFTGLIAAVVRSYRLTAADAADVTQTTWLLLVEHIDRIRDPERVGAWLASTARRECLRVLRRGSRIVLTADVESDATEPPADTELVGAERRAAVARALETLPDRLRALLTALMADPAPRYDEVAATLGMPVGSIGPTRARALERLRRSLELEDAAG